MREKIELLKKIKGMIMSNDKEMNELAVLLYCGTFDKELLAFGMSAFQKVLIIQGLIDYKIYCEEIILLQCQMN